MFQKYNMKEQMIQAHDNTQTFRLSNNTHLQIRSVTQRRLSSKRMRIV